MQERNSETMMDSDNKQAKLDIILPVYNTSRYLEQCIQSIVNQTFTEWQLVIIDDGSTDSSPEICDQWAERDSRITVVHKQNSGQGDSRNVAINMCKAEYIGFVDSDDWLEPDMYEFLVGCLEQHDADIAVCGHFNDFTDKCVCKNADNSVQVLDNETVHKLIIRDKIQSYIWQMVFRRKCLTRQMPGHICYEDYAVLPYWFKNVRRVVRTKRPLYHYRMRISSVVHTVTPEQEYAFLEAEEQRYRFYNGTTFANEVNLRMMVRCIRVAKYIARMDIQRDTVCQYLEKIKQRLKHVDNSCRKRLSNKDRMLRFLLLYHTQLFIVYQKVENVIMKKKKGNRDNLFR